MRILAASDIHGILPAYEWLVEMAGEHRVDMLILAGDLFAADEEDGQREQGRQIISVLKSLGTSCCYLMGNDDSVGLDYEDERIRSLHGRRLRLGMCSLVGYQYTPPFMGQTFVKPEVEIEEDLRAIEPLLEAQSILVTHAPAYGVLDCSCGGEHVGCRSLAALLDRKPVLAHIHGHIHESFGRDGNHFNVAASGLRRAILIDLQSLDHTLLLAD
jgi:uncharacterized protein